LVAGPIPRLIVVRKVPGRSQEFFACLINSRDVLRQASSYYLKNQWNSQQKLNLKKLCSITRRRNVSQFVITSLAPRIVSCVIIRNQTKSSANFSILSSEVRKYILHMSRWAIFPGTGKLQSR